MTYVTSPQRPFGFVVVMGNESCDLDSVACAISYSSLLNYEFHQTNTHFCAIPLINVYKNELHIKTDVKYCFDKFNLDVNKYMFREDLRNVHEMQKAHFITVVLVDHHHNPPFHDVIREIYDHHQVSDSLHFTDVEKIRISSIGSCSSLILDEMFQRADQYWMFTNVHLLYMLYGAMLLDTNNFSTVTKRFETLDVEMLQKVEPFILAHENKTRGQIYNELLSAKRDIQHLTPTDLLQKDLKKASSIYIVSLPILVQNFVRLNEAEDALKSFCEDSHVKELVLTGLQIEEDAGGENAVTKDIGFYSLPGSSIIDEIVEQLQGLAEPNLMLAKVNNSPHRIDGLRLFDIKNLLITRKHILPAVEKILKEASS